MELLPNEIFEYPTAFIELINRGIVDLEPWVVMEGEYLQLRLEGLRNRYPNRNLIPFARRIDNDDIACWHNNNSSKVIVIHDFASSGWENKKNFDDFWDWFRGAVEDMIEYIG